MIPVAEVPNTSVVWIHVAHSQGRTSLCILSHVSPHDRRINSTHVGPKIVQSMTDKKVVDYTFRKNDQAVTMNTKYSVKIRDDVVSVDPLLLFQHMVTAGIRSEDSPDIFSYELCT